MDDLGQALRSLLAQRGVTDAATLTDALRISQPTLSRAIAALAGEVLVLGAGRRTRYAWPQTILSRPARQPVSWVHEDGSIERLGTLSFIAGGRVHLAAAGLDLTTHHALPWPLAPMRGEGFIGRLHAMALVAHGLDRDPGRWPVEHQLFAALEAPDAPGAIVLGEPKSVQAPVVQGAMDLECLADDVARSGHAGSSAGGEQSKFLARRADGTRVLVKFTPPRGTPFGDRWGELLRAEALALALLAEHGVPVANGEVVEGSRRTFLVSTRFDRVGSLGRRHAVPLHAVHETFVGGPRMHWPATAEALTAQRRLPPEAAGQVWALHHFGRLIGNTDMHFGNLSLFVARGELARGRFTLAPLYDMLPMRWRPDPATGELGLLPFTPEPLDLQSAARPLAAEFWRRTRSMPGAGPEWRDLARTMAERLA